MIHTEPDEQQQATPPYFKSWRSIYWIVIANITLIILALYLMTNSFG